MGSVLEKKSRFVCLRGQIVKLNPHADVANRSTLCEQMQKAARIATAVPIRSAPKSRKRCHVVLKEEKLRSDDAVFKQDVLRSTRRSRIFQGIDLYLERGASSQTSAGGGCGGSSDQEEWWS